MYPVPNPYARTPLTSDFYKSSLQPAEKSNKSDQKALISLPTQCMIDIAKLAGRIILQVVLTLLTVIVMALAMTFFVHIAADIPDLHIFSMSNDVSQEAITDSSEFILPSEELDTEFSSR